MSIILDSIVTRPEKHVFGLLFLIVLLIVPPAALRAENLLLPRSEISDFVVNRASAQQVGRVLGFVIAQTTVLEQIIRQHPELAGESSARIAAFDATYGFPEQRARWYLEDAMGAEPAADRISSMREKIAASIDDLNRADAESFLADVDGRLQGQLDEAVLKAMLWLRFAASPDQEMQLWTQSFSSKGHAKAAGINLSLKTPLSWRQEEGNRPHVVSKWTSQDGTGDMVVTLVVRELPGQFTFDDMMEVETLGDWSWLVPDGSYFLGGRAIKVDRQPGLQLDTAGEVHVLDTRVGQKSRLYLVYISDRLVNIGCMISHDMDANDAIISKRFEPLQQLCRRIALSITFPDTYR